ncbi:hypothetical protein FB45DRAFT_1062354 [Roridomyces roridus]|uniref:Uncharacterized protein n=1 Tax=Roridomyces roridus TaxID=1738132 RepID=A0AAD7BHZ7_9AGAR|nr:hypothetical protein FB45DRAFT_1062354 [Roridomyces roridus]
MQSSTSGTLRLPTAVSFNGGLEDDLSLSSNAVLSSPQPNADKREPTRTMDQQAQGFLDVLKADLSFGAAPLLEEEKELEVGEVVDHVDVDFIPLPALSSSASPQRADRGPQQAEESSDSDEDIRSSCNPTACTGSPVRAVDMALPKSELKTPRLDAQTTHTPPTPRGLEELQAYEGDSESDMIMSPSPIPGLASTSTSTYSMQVDPDSQIPGTRTSTFEGDSESELAKKKLNDIRKSIAGHIVKERAILQALNKFGGSVSVPEIESDVGDAEDQFIAKIRLELLKDDLESARLKRLAVEKAVRDVVEESRPPFVCAALMDAFVDISRFSTRALNLQ